MSDALSVKLQQLTTLSLCLCLCSPSRLRSTRVLNRGPPADPWNLQDCRPRQLAPEQRPPDTCMLLSSCAFPVCLISSCFRTAITTGAERTHGRELQSRLRRRGCRITNLGPRQTHQASQRKRTSVPHAERGRTAKKIKATRLEPKIKPRQTPTDAA